MTRTLFVAVLCAALIGAGSPASANDDLSFERFPQPAPGTEFRDDFGYIRGRFHRGIDIFGEKGDPVVAVIGGIVERVHSSGRAGNYVVISHIGGWQSWYLHLNNDSPGTDDGKLGPERAVGGKVKVGWWIPAGEIVGFVGDSGNAEGTMPHTHFELHRDGDPVDPYLYLLDAYVLEQQVAKRLGAIH